MKTSRIRWRPYNLMMLTSHTWWRLQIQYLISSSHTSWPQTPGDDLMHLIMTSRPSWLTTEWWWSHIKHIYLTVTHMITTSSNWWRLPTHDDDFTKLWWPPHRPVNNLYTWWQIAYHTTDSNIRSYPYTFNDNLTHLLTPPITTS